MVKVATDALDNVRRQAWQSLAIRRRYPDKTIAKKYKQGRPVGTAD